MNKEAIELLKEAKEHICCPKMAKDKIDQALTHLKQQPKPLDCAINCGDMGKGDDSCCGFIYWSDDGKLLCNECDTEYFLVEQQPPASEFTRVCRKHLEIVAKMPWPTRINIAETSLRKACGIIDTSESSKADLLKAFRPLLTSYIEPLRGENNKVVGYNLKISKEQLEVIEVAIFKATPKEKKRGGCNSER